MLEAPRWRLIGAHYLKVEQLPDGTIVEWEHKETNKANGRTVRKLFPVPMLLEPKDSADHNYPGEIIVASRVEGARNLPNDIIFFGEPTQEMEPLNEAAETITEALRHKWINPVETLPANGGMNAQETLFMQQMMKAFAQANPQPVALPDEEGLKERIAKLEALIASMAPKPPEPTSRRA